MAARAWRPGVCRWQIAPPFEGAESLAKQVGSVPLVGQILHNRGIDDPDAARAFLDPKLTDLAPPEALAGVEAAAERLGRAAEAAEPIVLYGDYDVDGITGVAILSACLKLAGANVDYYVPHRLEEGYGVNVEAVRKIVADGARLLVTVDCGVSAAGPLAEATAAGVDVIVTDHHGLPSRLPEPAVIVHPDLPAGAEAGAPLAAAGVAFKLAWQFAKVLGGGRRVDEAMREFLLDATCLAALGTVADVVPLVGENRVLTVYGLRALPQTGHVGLRALLASAGLTGERLDAYHVGFVLAPRLNACGRMGHAREAVELLTTDSPKRARQIADYLAKQNAQRQKIERELTQQAIEMVVSRGLDDEAHRAIVLAGRAWHGGVIGIVASRLVDRFNRPTILIAIDEDGCGQGSGRSVPGFHMRDALAACSADLTMFGGHAMAAGIRLAAEKVEPFAAAFVAYANEHLPAGRLAPVLSIDAEATVAALSYGTVQRIGQLAPFGPGNPEPIVALRSCRVLVPPRRIGRNGQTVRMTLGQDGASIRAVGFGMGDLADHLIGVGRVDVAAQPVLNTFNGATTAELQLRDVVWD